MGCAIPTGAGKGKLEPAEDKAVYFVFVCMWCEWEIEMLSINTSISVHQYIHLYLSHPQGLAKVNWNLQSTRLCTLCVGGVNGK